MEPKKFFGCMQASANHTNHRKEKTMTKMLVIDTTNRGLTLATANVSRSQTGLVIRPALGLPGLGFFAEGADWRSPKDSGGLPVLLIGDGYQARSSAGFVSVTGAGLPYQTHPVVGWLGDHGLRVIRPRVARLLGPVRFVAEKSATNSNGQTAEAVRAGLPLLAVADLRSVVIAEGQSDRVRVWRLLPHDPAADRISSFEVTDLDEEFRGEMFAPEVVAQRLFRAAYRAEERRGESNPLVSARLSLSQSAERIPEIRFALGERVPDWRSIGEDYSPVPATAWEQAAIGTVAPVAPATEQEVAEGGMEEWARDLYAPMQSQPDGNS